MTGCSIPDFFDLADQLPKVTRVDNGHGVENEEQDTAIVLCSGTTQPWSGLWPSLRHYY